MPSIKKLTAFIEKIQKISLKIKVEVKCHQLLNTFSVHRGLYSYQVTPISDQ